MANCNPNSLAQQAACFCSDTLTQERISILLLCEWANGGGSCEAVAATDLTPGTPDTDSTTVGWTLASDPLLDFQVLWGTTDGGPYTESDTVAANLRSYEITGLDPDTEYFFIVRSRDSLSCTADSAQGTFTTEPENLNSVTWSPDDLMVDYDIGGGTVSATMAQFNLVDPDLVVAFAIENLGLDSIINLDELVNLEELRLSGNDLTELPVIPDSVTLLDVSNNDIAIISQPAWPSALETLFIANNPLDSLFTIPATLTIIDASNCQQTGPPDGSAVVGGPPVIWNFADNLIVTIGELPANLTELYLQNNDFSGGSIAFTGAGNFQITTVNVTDCNMVTLDAAALVNFVGQTVISNGTLSMLGNAGPDGTEGALDTLLAAGWTLLFETLAIPAPVAQDDGTTDTTVDLSWTWAGRTASIDEFEIQWGILPGVYTDNDTVSAATLSYQITGLIPETTYYVAVRAVAPGDQFYAAGNGPDSNELEMTTTA